MNVCSMSYWEEGERFRAYYLCLALIIGYVGLSVLVYMSWWTNLEGFVLAVLYTALILISRFGLGVGYRYRGINPDTRSMMTTADSLFLDPVEIEKQP
nr:MAG: hypothetical protein AM324_07565 [Candidatus Thorarchaeota archaeon SMTZ1-83]